MTSAAPAHALLSAAHSLLRPAIHHGRETTHTADKVTFAKVTKIAPQPPTDKKSETVDKKVSFLQMDIKEDPVAQKEAVDSSLLPIEQEMFTEDVTDLKDVVDAINKLCDTMKSSDYVAEDATPSIEDELREARSDYTVDLVSNYSSNQDMYMYSINEDWNESVSYSESYVDVGQEFKSEPASTVWNESLTQEAIVASNTLPGEVEQSIMVPLPGEVEQLIMVPEYPIGQVEEVMSDGEPALNWEGAGSELYYTASSEVSLVSDPDVPEKAIEMDDSVSNPLMTASMQEREEDCVVAGHVAAMRERFESLTRSTTPCLDSRTVSPIPIPDRL